MMEDWPDARGFLDVLNAGGVQRADVGEVVLASSPGDTGISCWDLHSGAELFRYRSCSSPPHGLTSVGSQFLASSQLRDPSSSSSSSTSASSILYWSWNKPQPEVRSFPAEQINPVVANWDGSYFIGGGVFGSIYLWEVASGKLLKKWRAHYRAVTCITFNDDDSLLISGAEDGSVRVWPLCYLFDTEREMAGEALYVHSFSEHSLRVTDVVAGYGGCDAIIVSSSEDRTCKVWSLSKGTLLRTVVFPSIVDAIALDPGEYAFYAGCRDGKIYISALNAQSPTDSKYGMHIIGSLSDNRINKAVTCLAFSLDGISLLSGSEDGTVRVWNTTSSHVKCIFKHGKGPITNVLVLRKPVLSGPQASVNTQGSISRRRLSSLMPPPLDKYSDSMDRSVKTKAIMALQASDDEFLDSHYISSNVLLTQTKQFQQHGSSASLELEVERLRTDCNRALQMVQKWKKMYRDLLQLSINEPSVDNQKEGNA